MITTQTTSKWEISEILFWYDEPLIFTLVVNNKLMLAFKYSETHLNPYWLGGVTQEQIQKLKDKDLTLKEIVDREGMLFDGHDINFELTGSIPRDCLPEQGTYLYLNP